MVQNITDVDDKIIRRATEGRPPLELAAEYARIFMEDLAALGVEEADVYPKVSDNIPEIIAMIPGFEKGYAYTVDGDVYYAVESFPSTVSFPGVLLTRWPPGPGLKWMNVSATRWILPFGKRRSLANRLGNRHGEKAVPAGILNVRPCP